MSDDLVVKSIDDYARIADAATLQEIKKLARGLDGEHIVMLNSTPSGGGVAEILNSMVVLMNTLGVDVGWRILKGSDNFFQVTKEFHNALQGGDIHLTKRKKLLYEQTNFNNALMTHIGKHDLVVVHDPQPLPFIFSFKKRSPWIWRCHIDLSAPNQTLLRYLQPFIEEYDAMIISTPQYQQKSLQLQQIVIPPSIDPLTPKNISMNRRDVRTILRRHGVRLQKPILAQISRFDKWKDPLGVLKVFERVRKHKDCQLVLMGNMAVDDPEGPEIYGQIMRVAHNNPDITILANAPDNDRTVNALQSAAHVVLQKSIREGFALTVSEAMWKGTPVVGTRVGGIPLQIQNGKTGYLTTGIRETADACLKVLSNSALRRTLGKQAKEHVRKNFLITRHVLDYLRMFDFYLNRRHHFNIGFDYPYASRRQFS